MFKISCEKGCQTPGPRNKDEVMKITDQQFRWLLEGLKIEQSRTIKKSNKRCAI